MTLGGIPGALIALPVTATLRAVIGYFYDRAAAPSPGLAEPVGPEAEPVHPEPN